MTDEVTGSGAAATSAPFPERESERTAWDVAAVIAPPRVVLLVLVFAVHLGFWVDMRLVFHARDRLFLLNVRFLKEFLLQPGAPLEWVDRLLVQLCYSGWPAVLVMSAILWILLISTIGFMNSLARARVGGTWVLPGALLLVVYAQYECSTSLLVGLALAMAVANVWARAPRRRAWLRMAAFVVIAAVLYYLTGLPGYGTFVACCVIREMLAERRWLFGALLLGASAGVKFGVDAAVSRIALTCHFTPTFFPDLHAIVLLDWRTIPFYVYFPVCELVVIHRQVFKALAGRLVQRFRRPEKKDSPPEPGRHGKQQKKDMRREGRLGPEEAVASGHRLKRFGWDVVSVLLVWAAAAAGYYAIDRDMKTSLEIAYCAEHQQWPDVLGKAGKLPFHLYSPSVNYDVNLALYHTGSLPAAMFAYPQVCEPVTMAGGMGVLDRLCGLLMSLGRVNNAEHAAHEMLEMAPTGRALKQLALAKLVKGEIDAARVVLYVLEDDLVWGDWAREHRRRLGAGQNLSEDQEIGQIRSFMLVEDDLHWISAVKGDGRITVSFTGPLEQLLERNRRNRMAFEYLMAVCLMHRDVDGVVSGLSRLNDMSYTEIPPLYEEAAIVYGMKHKGDVSTNGSGIFFRGRRISDQTATRLGRFQEILRPYGGPTPEGKASVAEELGDSYFYYFWYGSKGP